MKIIRRITHYPVLGLLLVSSLLLSSCKGSSDENKKGDEAPEFVMPETTALPASPFTDLPYPFRLSSEGFTDTLYDLSVSLDIPYSLDHSHHGLNAAVRKLMYDRVEGYRTPSIYDEENARFDYTSFEGWLHHLERKHQVVSMSFITQSFSWGAAHYNHYYLTLNYDLKNNKPVSFTDLFKASTPNEKLEFCYAVYGKDNYELAYNGLKPEDLHKQTKFYFEGDFLVFCFSDYEKDPSMEKIFASLEDVRHLLKPGYIL